MSSSDTDPRGPVLAAFNPETAARAPVAFGLAASRVLGTRLVVVTVRKGSPMVDRMAGETDDGAGAIRNLRLEFERDRADAEVSERVERTAGKALVDAMSELRPLLVVVGTTHRRRTGSALLGTTAERVIHESTCPVVVVPDGYTRPEGGIRRIGAAYAPTVEGREALHQAAVLARYAGGELRAIQVLDPKHAASQAHGMMAAEHGEVGEEQDESDRARVAAEEDFATAVAAEQGAGTRIELDVLFNEPADGIIAAAYDLDLLVMGSRAHGPRRSVLLGSVSRQVAERTPCPVMIVPRAAAETGDTLLEHAETT